MKMLNIILSVLFARLFGSDGYYEGYGQYGEGTGAEVQGLIKALEAQEGITDIANLVDGGALQPQSLETTLAMLTFQDKHLKFYKDIGTVKAYSTLEEYNIQDGYGSEGGFVGQMENPEEADPDFQRKYAVVKYIRTLWKTSDVLTLTRTVTSPEMKNKQAAMMRALRVCERTLFYGNTDYIPSSFDGLEKTTVDLATADHVIDMRGAALTEQVLKQAAELISVNYGTPTKMYTSPGTQTALDSLLYAGQRLNQESISAGGLVALGHKTTEMRTSYGNFVFEPDIFLSFETETVPKKKDPSTPGTMIEGATSEKAPAMPSFALTAQTTVTGSKWLTGEQVPPGTYGYRVSAINKYGKSIAAAAQTQAVASVGSVTVTITTGAGAYAETAYEVYREVVAAGGDYKLLGTIAKAPGGGTTAFVDLNATLSGYAKNFLVDNTTLGEDRTMALKQLAPMHSVEYAKIAPYRWGTVNFYAVPIFYAPLRNVMFKNCLVTNTTRNPLIDV